MLAQNRSAPAMSDTTTEYPYDTIVRITDVIGGQDWQGSGVLIAPNEVLTASHVVYMQGEGSANDIVVTPGYSDGSAPYGSDDGTYIQYFQIDDANDSITNQQSQYDYAVITLATPLTSLGYMGIESNFDGGTVNVTGYPASANGAQINSVQNVTVDPNDTLLVGSTIGKGSSGGPVWIEGTNGPYVVGVVSSESDTGNTGYFVQITTSVYNQIETWLQQDAASSNTQPTLTVFDTTTNQSVAAVGQTYSGPVAGLTSEYITSTTDSLNVAVTTPGWFIHTGSGNDAITVSSGTNVIDGSTGSNFLTGGSGTDTFYVDDRNATAPIWSTINNFHAGDAATIWGVTPSDFTLTWTNGLGAPGYTGLTLGATSATTPAVDLTLVGYATADLTNGKLTVSFGTTAATTTAPGSAYMEIQAA